MITGSLAQAGAPGAAVGAASACRQPRATRQAARWLQPCQRHAARRPLGALADVEAAPLSSVDIASLVYADGRFTVEGCLLTAASPETVYQVLTDYDSLPRVFHNVETSELQACSRTGQKQLVQKCKWAFLVFSGTFVNELRVVEDAEQRQLTFSLVESAFMREFVGSWDVRGRVDGVTEVRHRLSVTPVVSPPQRIGDISKKIFRSQVVGILEDLNAELAARLA